MCIRSGATSIPVCKSERLTERVRRLPTMAATSIRLEATQFSLTAVVRRQPPPLVNSHGARRVSGLHQPPEHGGQDTAIPEIPDVHIAVDAGDGGELRRCA